MIGGTKRGIMVLLVLIRVSPDNNSLIPAGVARLGGTDLPTPGWNRSPESHPAGT